MSKAVPNMSFYSPRIWTKFSTLSWLVCLNLAVLSFLLARASLMGDLYPFGVAFLAGLCTSARTTLSQTKTIKAVLLGTVGGTLTIAGGWQLAGQLASMGLVYGVLTRYQGKNTHWLTIPALVASIHVVARGAGVILMDNQLYQWLGVLFEGFFVGVLTLVSHLAVPAWPRLINHEQVTAEERTSLGLLILGALLGIGEAGLGGLSLQSIAARWLVLCGALLGGAGGGAAVGVAAGLLPSIQGNLTTGPIAFFAISGMLGGVFNSFKKSGVVVGVIAANLLMSLFFSEEITLVQSLQETGAAVLLFFITPLFLTQQSASSEQAGSEGIVQLERLHTADRIKKIGELFFELQKAFNFSKEKKQRENELKDLFDKVSSRVCEGCSLHRVCWEQDFYKTYRGMVEACNKMEKTGKISENDFGTEIKRRCRRLRELTATLHSQLELLMTVAAYEKQLESCRGLVNQQLQGLAQIVENFADEVRKGLTAESAMGVLLKEKLAEKGLHVQGIEAIQVAGGEKEIVIRQQVCAEENWCKSLVAPNVSQIIGKAYTVKSQECQASKETGMCTYRLSPTREFQVKVGKAQCPKEGTRVSGDICAALNLSHQRLALIMCDGMGTGEEAHAESSVAIGLLEKLLLAGFSAEGAVKTVNTVLLLRSGQEKFVTLDLVIINLVNGIADFIKIGGAPSLVSSSRGIRTVQSPMPPAGILESFDMKLLREAILPNDLIIMMSDGVWEAFHNAGGPAGWLEAALIQMDLKEPQHIANYLLMLAKKASGNRIKDDMCIQVAKVEQQGVA